VKPFLIHGIDLGFDITEKVIVEKENSPNYYGHIANRLKCRICGWITTDNFYSTISVKEAVLFHSERCPAFDFLDSEAPK